MANDAEFWRAYERPDPDDEVPRPVLEQAVGATLADGEAVACARFVLWTRGRVLGSAERGSHLAVVTDRRVVRVTAWTARGWQLLADVGDDDQAGSTWRAGARLDSGYITRWSLWHGETSGAELELDWPGRRRLVIATRGRGRQLIVARTEAAAALHLALVEALAGEGAATPPRPDRG